MRVTGLDTSHYPTVRATVVSSAGSRVRPALTENGRPVSGLQATNLAQAKAVVVAIDRSRSMRTKFGDAIAAARGFVASKPLTDRTALQTRAQETGGTFYTASSSAALADVYTSIANNLRKTWRVEYVTAARPGDLVHLQAAAAGAGTATASTTIPTSFGQAAPSEPSKLVPKSAYGPSGPLAVGLAVSGLVLLALVLVLAAYRGSWVRSRIAAHVGETKGSSKQHRRERRVAALTAVFQATERTFGNLKQWRWTQRTLERADLPLRTVEFFWIVVGAAVGLGLVAAVAGQSSEIGRASCRERVKQSLA